MEQTEQWLEMELRYLPVDGVEEAKEVVQGGTKTGTEFGGEFLDEIGHLLHVLLHSRFQLLHRVQNQKLSALECARLAKSLQNAHL